MKTWRDRDRQKCTFVRSHGLKKWEGSKYRWPGTYLGLLFLVETFRGRVPVALGGCLHHTVLVVMLQIRSGERDCVRGQKKMAQWETNFLIVFFFFLFQTGRKLLPSYLCGYEGGTWRVVQAGQLALWVEVCGCGGLRFDDGGEFVGGVIHSGSVGKVNESTGREAVTTRWRTPEDTVQQDSSHTLREGLCV